MKTDLLEENAIQRIVDEAQDVLEKVGVWVENDECLALLGDGGAKIDKAEKRAYIPRTLVEQSLKTAPSSIQFYDREGNPSMDVSGDKTYFIPASAVNIWDAASKKMVGVTTEACINHIRVVDALPYIDGQMPPQSNEFPRDIWDLTKVFLSLKYSTKTIYASVQSKESFQPWKEMCLAVRGDAKALKEKPFLYMPIAQSSPLRWSDVVSHAIMRAAELSIPPSLVPCPIAGAAAPVTLAGAIVQEVAENLSGVVITQLINKGAPVIWASCGSSFDYKFGTSPYGSIESKMILIGCSEVGKYLGLPTGSHVACSDAKRPDEQSSMECMLGAMMGALSPTNLVYGVGALEFLKSVSNESVLIGNEIVGYIRRLMEGVALRGERLAEDLFTPGLQEGKHFLLSPSTVKWFKVENYVPGPVIDRRVLEVWEADGATTAYERAEKAVQKILATHKPKPLDTNIDKELMKIMTTEIKKHGMSELPSLPTF